MLLWIPFVNSLEKGWQGRTPLQVGRGFNLWLNSGRNISNYNDFPIKRGSDKRGVIREGEVEMNTPKDMQQKVDQGMQTNP